MAADDRAIVVGISHYPGIGDLAGPENDALAFAEWLSSPSEGNVPEENIDLILSSAFPRCKDAVTARPTADAVKEAIDKLYVIGDDSAGHVGRRLYLFMAGHGLAFDLRDAALLMANAAKNRTGHHIPGSPYADWFCKSAYFEEVVLVMDCCLENGQFSPRQPCHLDDVAPSGNKHVRQYYAIAAEFSRPAREIPDQNGQMRGVFTSAILAGLRQAPPGGGDVTGAWLEIIVPQFMTRLLKGQESQTPNFYYQRNDDIIFVKSGTANYRVRIHASRPGRTVELCDGALNGIPPSGHSSETWEWELGPGIYGYGYAGDQRNFLELIEEKRDIDVQL